MYRTQLKNKRSDLELSGQHYFEVDILKEKKVKKDCLRIVTWAQSEIEDRAHVFQHGVVEKKVEILKITF
jgi:hypothetical protein